MQKNNPKDTPMYKNKNIGKTVRITKQINNDIYFIIDSIEEILDVSVFNEHYEVVEPFISEFEVVK